MTMLLLLLLFSACATPEPGGWDTGPVAAMVGTRRALLVAPDLDDPDLGAAVSLVRMAGVLRERGFLVRTLEGEAASASAVRSAIRASRADLREVGDDDDYLVYVVGHGGFELDAARRARPVLYLAGGSRLPIDDLLDEVDAVDGDAVVLDACLVGEEGVEPWMSPTPHRAHLLTASAPDEAALAASTQGGVYTAALVDALQQRGGLLSAHSLAAATLLAHPPSHRGSRFDQRPTLVPGGARGELELGATGGDPPLLLDGLSRTLAGTGTTVVVDGAPLDGRGALDLAPGPHEIHLERGGGRVAGSARHRQLERGDVLRLPGLRADLPGPAAAWLRPTLHEAPVVPSLSTSPLPVDCAVPEGVAVVELDPDTPGTELFLTCRGPDDHPHWLVWSDGKLVDRSDRLGLSGLPPGGRPAPFGGGVCYVQGVVGGPGRGPLTCVGVSTPSGIHSAAPESADLDGDGAAEQILNEVGEIVVVDDGRRHGLGARPQNAVRMRLDADARMDLVQSTDGRIDGFLNLDGAWAPVLAGRVSGVSAGLALFDDGGASFGAVAPDTARNAAHILSHAVGRPILAEEEIAAAPGGEQLAWTGADLDGDGRTDLVGARPATVLLRRDRGWQALDLDARMVQLLPVDLDGDGDLDLVGIPESRTGIVVVDNDVPVRGRVRLRLPGDAVGDLDVELVAGDHRQRVRVPGELQDLVLSVGEQEPDRVVVVGADGVNARWGPARLRLDGPRSWVLDTRSSPLAGPRLLAGRLVIDLASRPYQARTWQALADLSTVQWALRIGDLVAVHGQRADGRWLLRWLDGAGQRVAEQPVDQPLSWPSGIGDRLVAHTDGPERLVVASPGGLDWRVPDRGGLRQAVFAFGRAWLAVGRTHIQPLDVGSGVGAAGGTLDELACPTPGCVDREVLVASADGRDLFVVDTWRPGVEHWHDGLHAWTATMPTIRRPRPGVGASWDPVGRRLLLPVDGGVDALVPGDSPAATRPRVVEDGYAVNRVVGLGTRGLATLERDGASRRLVLVDELADRLVVVPLDLSTSDGLLVLPPRPEG